MFSQVSLCPGGGGGQVGDRVSLVPGPFLGPCPFGSWDISGGNTLPALWDTLPVRDIGPEIPYPLEGTWDQRCSTLQKGHGTRYPTPQKGHGTRNILPPPEPRKRAVRILLECILVTF